MQPGQQPPLRETGADIRQQPASAIGASPITGWRAYTRNLAIAAAAGVFLAFSGAMETHALPLATRLAYWVPLMMGGALVGHGIARGMARVPRLNMNKWLFGAALALAMSIPTTFVVWGYTNWVFRSDVPLAALPALFGAVLVIAAAMCAIMVAVNWPGRVTHAGAEAPKRVRFLDRLPPKLMGGVIYAVSAEDHYLRLHTSKGSDLILMRLSDAIGELDGIEGAQTHRSWWVAREAVESARRDGDRAILTLRGGIEAPVSRPNVKPLRDAGWF